MQRPLLATCAALSLAVSARAQAPGVFDHLACRQVRDRAAPRRYVTDLDTGDAPLDPGCVVRLPARLLCTDTRKTNVRPAPPGTVEGPPAARYLCYRMRCRGRRTIVDAEDQFGRREVEVRGARLLCAPLAPDTPSETTLPPPTTTTTSTTTTSTSTPTTSSAPTSTTTTSSTTIGTTSTSSTTIGTTSTSSTTSTTMAPSPGACPVVNEIMTGTTASAAEEFVELLNPCAEAVDLGGARLLYRSASGTTDFTLVAWPPGATIAPGARLVYAGGTWTGTKDGDLGAALAAAGGGVAVVDANGAVVDSVGWGTATNAFIEGTPAPAPPRDGSVGRVPDGVDTDDNAADFRESAAISPGGRNA